MTHVGWITNAWDVGTANVYPFFVGGWVGSCKCSIFLNIFHGLLRNWNWSRKFLFRLGSTKHKTKLSFFFKKTPHIMNTTKHKIYRWPCLYTGRLQGQLKTKHVKRETYNNRHSDVKTAPELSDAKFIACITSPYKLEKVRCRKLSKKSGRGEDTDVPDHN